MTCCNVAWLSDPCYPPWISSVAKAGAGECIQGNLGVILGSNGVHLTVSSSVDIGCPKHAPLGIMWYQCWTVARYSLCKCQRVGRGGHRKRMSFHATFLPLPCAAALSQKPQERPRCLSILLLALCEHIPSLYPQLISS